MNRRYEAVVVGSGLAGLTYALHAAERGPVCVLTKAAIAESNTQYAQGGIAAAVGESDSWELHERDTLIAGAGMCDAEAVRFLVRQAPSAIRWLQDLGARFDVNDLLELHLGQEGGHSRKRIVHHSDRTGWEVERAVSEAVLRHPGIEVFEHVHVIRIKMLDGRAVGVDGLAPDMDMRSFFGKSVMLATGGCGKVYAHTTNPRVATGDGLRLAQEAGAELRGMAFIQFHPTTLSHPQRTGYLITEAVRGAGATLRNHMGRRFMFDYDPRLELAPRDIVARSIMQEMERLDTWCVYLDMTHLPADQVEAGFPTIWKTLRSLDIEMEKDWIPIVPAQHYSCGGVATDLAGRTRVPGLYASGETAWTGVHGANRLASNSLLEAMVFSIAAAASSADEPDLPQTLPGSGEIPKCPSEAEAIAIRHSLQRMMSSRCGVFRSTAGLAEAKAAWTRLKRRAESRAISAFSPYAFEVQSLLTAAGEIIEDSIRQPRNVGLFYNVDFAEGSEIGDIGSSSTP
jgi:L-aspartate oxidase